MTISLPVAAHELASTAVTGVLVVASDSVPVGEELSVTLPSTPFVPVVPVAPVAVGFGAVARASDLLARRGAAARDDGEGCAGGEQPTGLATTDEGKQAHPTRPFLQQVHDDWRSPKWTGIAENEIANVR
jgi:hypothetical protein